MEGLEEVDRWTRFCRRHAAVCRTVEEEDPAFWRNLFETAREVRRERPVDREQGEEIPATRTVAVQTDTRILLRAAGPGPALSVVEETAWEVGPSAGEPTTEPDEPAMASGGVREHESSASKEAAGERDEGPAQTEPGPQPLMALQVMRPQEAVREPPPRP